MLSVPTCSNIAATTTLKKGSFASEQIVPINSVLVPGDRM